MTFPQVEILVRPCVTEKKNKKIGDRLLFFSIFYYYKEIFSILYYYKEIIFQTNHPQQFFFQTHFILKKVKYLYELQFSN